MRIKKQKLTEKQLQNLLLSLLTISGHYVWRNNSGVVTSTYKGKKRMWRAGITGSSDILGIQKDTGKLIAVECKSGKNKITVHQELFLQEIKERGGIAIVAYAVSDCKQLLTKELYSQYV